MKNFWNNNKEFRVFVWTVFNAVLAFIGTQLAGVTWPEAVIIAGIAIPFLNALTKFVNVKWFWDMWVSE